MALGGGTFQTQNKVLPGTYINFISTATADAALGDRGYAAMPLELDWGMDDGIFTVTNEDFYKNSAKIFGYAYTHEKMKGLRDLFQNISVLYAYKLTGGGVKASNEYAAAKYSGIRGNDLRIMIQANVDDNAKFDVLTYLETTVVDKQTVAQAAELTANDYVSFKTGAELAITASTPLTGGTNNAADGTAHQSFLNKIESYPSINAIGVLTTEAAIKSLYTAFVKRMRDEVGIKFQVVMLSNAADYEGIVNLKNTVADEGWETASLVYWVTGIIAGSTVNTSNTNKIYNGEFTVNVDYTQSELEEAIRAGEFVLHQVGTEIRVLEDINSLVTGSEEKGEVFKDNQTIRVTDQIATDIAKLFVTKYLGTVPNNAAGRVSLWADIVKLHEQLQDIRAIENFSDEDVTVSQGDKKSVVITEAVTVVNTMAKLYMTVEVA